jgi:hypothetical protein
MHTGFQVSWEQFLRFEAWLEMTGRRNAWVVSGGEDAARS